MSGFHASLGFRGPCASPGRSCAEDSRAYEVSDAAKIVESALPIVSERNPDELAPWAHSSLQGKAFVITGNRQAGIREVTQGRFACLPMREVPGHSDTVVRLNDTVHSSYLIRHWELDERNPQKPSTQRQDDSDRSQTAWNCRRCGIWSKRAGVLLGPEGFVLLCP